MGAHWGLVEGSLWVSNFQAILTPTHSKTFFFNITVQRPDRNAFCVRCTDTFHMVCLGIYSKSTSAHEFREAPQLEHFQGCCCPGSFPLCSIGFEGMASLPIPQTRQGLSHPRIFVLVLPSSCPRVCLQFFSGVTFSAWHP